MRIPAIALAAVAAIAATGASAQTYTQDFSNPVAGQFAGVTHNGTASVTPSGERYLQLTNGQSATFLLSPTGSAILAPFTFAFDLYGLRSLDGNGPGGGGPDPFDILVDDAVRYSFNVANYTGNAGQSFNGNLNEIGGPYAPRSGQVSGGTLGYGAGDFGDSIYRIAFDLPTGARSVTLVGRSNQDGVDPNGGQSGDEAYGIDNVRFSSIAAAVPEPATWAMMIVGFGVVGFAMRRRTNATTAAFAA